MKLTFKPINLDKDLDLCKEFRIDSYAISFGNADKFYRENGEHGEKYVEYLKKKISLDPNYAVHVFEEDKIVGQMEMGPYKDDPEKTGYINLYYLIPEVRGKGYGKILDEHASKFLRNKGFTRARLSVSPTNHRALNFYLKNDWKDLGKRPGHPDLHLMEKSL